MTSPRSSRSWRDHLEVRTRRSKRPRRCPVLITDYQDDQYLVALAGESPWPRNVGAADGHAMFRLRGVTQVRLEGLTFDEWAEVAQRTDRPQETQALAVTAGPHLTE